MKFFGWHLYASREKLRLVPVNNCRGNGLSRRIKELRNRRYRQRRGCCEQCGQAYDKAAFQMHHILPFHEFPGLARKAWNMIMLCPRCHYILHSDVTQQMVIMQRVAREHGINLQQEFHAAAARCWQEKQARKGGAL